jgi:hypothetical protein
MSKFSKVLKAGAVAALVVAVAGGSVFAASLDDCVGSGKRYPNLSSSQQTGWVKCSPIQVKGSNGNYTSETYWGKTSADCAQLGTVAADPDSCKGNDLNGIVKLIINAVIFIIGIIAVIMIILGGVTYATSQGDSGKVKKGKDTILYGIIGLVVALLAFAIVNFVLSALQG